MSRDDEALWEYTLIAACRQDTAWCPFLFSQERETWIATDDDINNGLEVADENGINQEATLQVSSLVSLHIARQDSWTQLCMN